MSSVDTLKKVKINTTIKEPNLYSVVYLNDEKTTAVFVAETLVKIFNYEIDAAIQMTEQISKNGSGVAISGITKELATHLRDLVLVSAQTQNFPLKIEIKAD